MNYSYIMGVDNVDSLDRTKFDIEEIDGDYGVSFEDDYIEEYEEFIKENLRPTYWNEYLGEEIVFIFKMDNGTIKRIVRDELNDEEIHLFSQLVADILNTVQFVEMVSI